MTKDTFARIEAIIRRLKTANPRKRAELLALLKKLKAETMRLSKTHAEHAKSLAGFAEVAAHEATRQSRSPHLLDLSLKGLASSVKDFETSHPELVKLVNTASSALASLGI